MTSITLRTHKTTEQNCFTAGSVWLILDGVSHVNVNHKNTYSRVGIGEGFLESGLSVIALLGRCHLEDLDGIRRGNRGQILWVKRRGTKPITR